MSNRHRIVCALARALYLDLPYILDSIWRRAEFDVNRWFRYTVTAAAGGVEVQVIRRPYLRLLPFWLYVIVLVFVAYGPTFDSLCSVFGARGMAIARFALGVAFVGACAYLLIILTRFGIARTNKRFLKAHVHPSETLRRSVVRTVVEVGVCSVLTPIALIGVYLWTHANMSICHEVPSARPAVLQLSVTLIAVAAAALAARRLAATQRRTLQDGLLLGVVVATLWLWVAAPFPSEATQTPYPHVYAVLALALAGIAMLAPRWARFQFASIIAGQRSFYAGALKRVELFPGSRVDPDLSTRRIVAATVTGVCYHIAQLLLLPSFFLLIVASHWMQLTAAVGLLASIDLLTMGSLTTRWQQMVRYVTRWFLVGTPLVVSVAVIALALLRLGRVQYVATILDAAPFGVIFIWIVMTYALFWWFEYAINTGAGMELLRLLGSDSDAETGRVPYLPDSTIRVSMPVDHRWIAPHGLGRFVALGWCRDKDSHEPLAAFQSYDFVELFSRLTPPNDEDRRNDLKRRLQIYFLALNALVAGAFLLYLGYYGHADRSNTVDAVVTAHRSSPADGSADFEALLMKQASEGRPAIIVAASGGGTRAALFTASALEGLAKLGVSRDIVLLSGVSGGGVAVAYFYAHQGELLAPFAENSRAWHDFKYHMTDPFIGDVLEGASEWRLVSREALGMLLKESFDRQLFRSSDLQRLGDAKQPALILNTTITGHPQEDSDLLRGMFSASLQARLSCDARHEPYANISGGRLIFTNLKDRSAFPMAGGEVGVTQGDPPIPDVRLPYVVVNDPLVPLAAAAALNANFPPVFTNARVTIPSEAPDNECPMRSYYVTDGGATENLGLVSSLYALRRAVANIRKIDAARIPQIHLVLLEASATTYDYTPDRGINAASGGSKERLTGGLTLELLQEVSEMTKRTQPAASGVKVHDLAMPLAFRSRGGFGTNWMFPNSIEIANPRTPHPAPWYASFEWWRSRRQQATASLGRDELIELWTELHDPTVPFCGSGPQNPGRDQSMQTVANWICGVMGSESLPADIHVAQWQELVRELK